MSDTSLRGSLEPVLDVTRYQSKVRAIVAAVILVAGVLGIDLAGLDSQIETILTAAVVLLGLVLTLVDFVRTRIGAWRVRSVVTPLANPRTAELVKLVPQR